jgi:hypothetical protein
MRLSDFEAGQIEGRSRISMRVTWEDVPREDHELFFETDSGLPWDLTPLADPFLTASAIPALRFGERRVRVDGEVCPELVNGLETALEWLRLWFGGEGASAPRIEAATYARGKEGKEGRAGCFFSGGIDSFATLRRNMLLFPEDHPWRIKDGILVYGLELDDPKAFGHVRKSLEQAAKLAGIECVTVYSNLYLVFREEDAATGFRFWLDYFSGAALAAVAHALGARLRMASIASTFDIPTLAAMGRTEIKPFGSHPLLDPNYSSSTLTIRHACLPLTRLERTRLVAGWQPALDNLRVCNRFHGYDSGSLNCGACEKCIRTMLALIAVGALERCPAFPGRDLNEDQVAGVRIKRPVPPNPYTVEPYYLELIPALEEVGRRDLVRGIRRALAGSRMPRNGRAARLIAFCGRGMARMKEKLP